MRVHVTRREAKIVGEQNDDVTQPTHSGCPQVRHTTRRTEGRRNKKKITHSRRVRTSLLVARLLHVLKLGEVLRNGAAGYLCLRLEIFVVGIQVLVVPVLPTDGERDYKKVSGPPSRR